MLLQHCGYYDGKPSETMLTGGLAAVKTERNKHYLLRLKNENLTLPYEFEAGLYGLVHKKTDFHWGWDSPLSPLRGTFTGHWLSAVAQNWHMSPDPELKLRAERVVDIIKRCQEENGNGWAFGIPEKYLHRVKNGKHVWAPQYVCHKTMMGLLDMYRFMGNETALEIVKGCAEWFYTFTADISRETMSDMMDLEETGGIMEFWADLYAITGEEKHLTLMKRYERPRLFEPLLNGEDVLTNMHANSVVPEIHGAARAYEVTGDERYRAIVERFWEWAVTKRGFFATGGQTAGELWTPPGMQSARLGDKNQELCVVYNMMRLSQYLYCWTGDKAYADYWERNLYNGVYAQGYWEERNNHLMNEDYQPAKGHVVYYLPLEAGGHKLWGSETDHFWCCHCTLTQANANIQQSIYYKTDDGVIVSQYLPSQLQTDINGAPVQLTQSEISQTGPGMPVNDIERVIQKRPDTMAMRMAISGNGARFTVRFRQPFWLAGPMRIVLNGQPIEYDEADGYASLSREWNDDNVEVFMPRALTVHPLPDKPDMAAFLYGPVTLAGLTAEERTLYGDINHPDTILIPDCERQWQEWLPYFRTQGQPINFRFVPLYEIGNERYTVYFPVMENTLGH